jgi:tyrosinase
MAENKDAKPKWTRYQRVKEILNKAQGDTCPSYQGYGKFWELPLDQFLNVEIYGVRMIAPGVAPATLSAPSGGSCCHTPPAAPQSGRGTASGLIIGLKGKCPFDGTQFPSLLWDGTPVPGADIQFIQDWIDAGCPADDDQRAATEVRDSQVMARARGDEEHPLSSAPSNQYHEDDGSGKVRKNINSLTPEELRRFRNAVAGMKSLDKHYQDQRSFAYWARMHADACQHGWEEFLPWHRLYLYYFEQQLQDIDPTVALPYWDWTDSTTPDLQLSIIDATKQDPSIKTDNGIIPDAYQCFLTQDGWNTLQAGGLVPADVLDKLQKKIVDTHTSYNSGLRLFEAAGIQYGTNKASDAAIMTVLGQVNPLWHKLRWPGGDQGLLFEGYPTSDDVTRILQLPSFFNFGSGPMNNHFFGALENIHNLIHNFSGGANPYYVMGTNPMDRNGEPQNGDMVNAGVTAFDPIFWGHHSNVDRLWAQWEGMHPGASPDNLSSILPPFKLNVQDTLNIANFGYEYLKSSHLYPVNNTVPITKFKSAKTPVLPSVMADHSHAEVRLHKVQYRTRGGFHVRVFLNSPQADVNTPTRGNDHYVGQVSTFSGFCVGGPGHCDPPKEHRRKFDLRGRPHKTPGNFHLDATETVQKLSAQGETAFQVNLVVMNTDATPATDALLLNAVSLVFKE